ncbi:hypothetical protein [Paenibacillus lemnae]|nr:hypothetical protein [Paenibacillus lemnae]
MLTVKPISIIFNFLETFWEFVAFLYMESEFVRRRGVNLKKIALIMLVFLTLVGCSQKENDLVNVESSEKSAAETSSPTLLSDLANQEFSIKENQISAGNHDSIVTFGKAFVNLYTGAVAEQERVTFENYISNKNLLKFTDKVLDVEQKQNLKGGTGVTFGSDNTFNKTEFKKLDENLYYLSLTFSNQGSGMSCKLLVQSEDKALKIVDWYFGNKDGVDTAATGHPAVRKLDNPELWDDQQWVDHVFKKLEKYESELNT